LRFGISQFPLGGLRALEQLDPLAGGELDDRLLPRSSFPDRLRQVAPLRLRSNLRGPHRGDVDAEDLFDRLGDLGLVGAVVVSETALETLKERLG